MDVIGLLFLAFWFFQPLQGETQLVGKFINRTLIHAELSSTEAWSQPVLLTIGSGLASKSSGEMWNMERVVSQFGNLTLHATSKRRQTMKVEDYFLASREDVGFEQLFSPSTGVSRLLDSLLAEVKYRLPPLLADMRDRPIASVGRGGTGSQLHQHDASWLYLGSGVKEWLLLPPGTLNLREAMDSNPCNLKAEFPDLHWSICTQAAGEILYLPKGTWHATCNRPNIDTTFGSIGTQVVLGAGVQGFAKKSDRLLYAARDGDVSEIEKICLAGPLNQDSPSSTISMPSEKTAMHVAASHDRLAVMERLLEPKCGGLWMMHAPAGSTGDLPVHAAAQYGSLNVLRNMLQREPGLVNATSRILLRTPLHMAAYYGHSAVIDLLLTSGAEIHARLSSGDTAIHRAAEGSQLAALELLLERRGDPTTLDNSGLPAVQLAARRGHQPVMLHFLGLRPPAGHEQFLFLSNASLEHRLAWKASIRSALENASSALGVACISSSAKPGFPSAVDESTLGHEL